MRRVLKLGGRLVVGEAFLDPTWSRSESSRREQKRQDLGFERRSARPLGYFARFAV